MDRRHFLTSVTAVVSAVFAGCARLSELSPGPSAENNGDDEAGGDEPTESDDLTQFVEDDIPGVASMRRLENTGYGAPRDGVQPHGLLVINRTNERRNYRLTITSEERGNWGWSSNNLEPDSYRLCRFNIPDAYIFRIEDEDDGSRQSVVVEREWFDRDHSITLVNIATDGYLAATGTNEDLYEVVERGDREASR